MGDLVFQRKHTMAQRTLFSVLLRQPWWTSAMVGVVLFGLTQLAYPPIAPFVGLPFLFIALYVAYRQWRTLSPEKINKRLEKITQMNWSSFSTLICAAYRRQGYEVVAVKKNSYDFQLLQQGRITLLQCRRWKGHRMGSSALEELNKAMQEDNAYNAISICASDFSPQSYQYALGQSIHLVHGAELAILVGKLD